MSAHFQAGKSNWVPLPGRQEGWHRGRFRSFLEGGGLIQTKQPRVGVRWYCDPDGADKERTAATYSRASYTCTTIGNEVFDGRVRDGIGSGHLFMATEKMLKSRQDSGTLGGLEQGF